MLKFALLAAAISIWSFPAAAAMMSGQVLVTVVCGTSDDMNTFLTQAGGALMGHGKSNAGTAVAVWGLSDGQFVIVDIQGDEDDTACIINAGQKWKNVSPIPTTIEQDFGT